MADYSLPGLWFIGRRRKEARAVRRACHNANDIAVLPVGNQRRISVPVVASCLGCTRNGDWVAPCATVILGILCHNIAVCGQVGIMILSVIGKRYEPFAVRAGADSRNAVVKASLIHRHQYTAFCQEDGSYVSRISVCLCLFFIVYGVRCDGSIYRITFLCCFRNVQGYPQVVCTYCKALVSSNGICAVFR